MSIKIKYIKKILYWGSICTLCFLLLRECFRINNSTKADTTHKSYIWSEDSINCITVIKYDSSRYYGFLHYNWLYYFNKKKYRSIMTIEGVYYIPEKFEGYLPTENYLFTDYADFGNHGYVKWENDTTYLFLSTGGIKEDKLDTTRVIMVTWQDVRKSITDWNGDIGKQERQFFENWTEIP